jgi:hypothetical protein
LKQIDKWIKKFVWSGSIDSKKLVSLSWKKMCTPLSDGGLGMRSISKINEAGCLKLCWDLMHSKSHWFDILRNRFFTNNKPRASYIVSSIWPGVKKAFLVINQFSIWKVGDSKQISFWKDKWLSTCISDVISDTIDVGNLQNVMVEDIIVNGEWRIPHIVQQIAPFLASEIRGLTIPSVPIPDSYIWEESISGLMSFKDAYINRSSNSQPLPWCKLIWSPVVQPARTLVLWRVFHNIIATDDNLRRRGFLMVSCCSLCNQAYETSQHLFFECPFAIKWWNWLSSSIEFPLDISSPAALLSILDRNWSSQVKDLLISAITNIVWLIWGCQHHLQLLNHLQLQNLLCNAIYLSASNSKGTMKSSIQDFKILKFFKVACHPPSSPKTIQVNWIPPRNLWIKCNFDGAFKGCPGLAACGGILILGIAEVLLLAGFLVILAFLILFLLSSLLPCCPLRWLMIEVGGLFGLNAILC